MKTVQKMVVGLAVLLIAFSLSINVQAVENPKGAGPTININKAPVADLVRLEKVGKKVAQRIVDYRTKNGPFQKSEDITKVKGIGKKIWEVNKKRIVVK